LKRGVAAGRLIIKRDGTRNSILPVGEVLVLPDPVGTVDLRVVQEEVWVTGKYSVSPTASTIDACGM